MGQDTRRKIQGLGAAAVLLLIIVGCALGATLLNSSVRDRSLDSAEAADVATQISALRSVQERIESDDVVEFREFEVPYQLLLIYLDTTIPANSTDATVRAAHEAVQSYVEELRSRIRGVGVLAGSESVRGDVVIDELGGRALDSITEVRAQAGVDADDAYRNAVLGTWITALVAALLCFVGIRHLIGTTRRVQELEGFRRADDRVRALMQHAPDIVAVVGADGAAWSYASPAIESVLGYSLEEFLAGNPGDLVHPDDSRQLGRTFATVLGDEIMQASTSLRLRHGAGHWVHVELSLSDQRANRDIRGIVANIRDVSSRVELERSLAHQAQHDALTGLSNRAYFVELAERAVQTATRLAPVSIVFVDLDGFKEINDSLGHGAGDEVLMTVAARLLTLTRHRDYVARLGGDEFAILLVGDAPDPVARRLLEALNQPIDVGAGPVYVGASVGITTTAAGASVDDLMRDADVAMYDAKARGKNRVSEFAPEMHQALLERLELRTAIDSAIAANEFFMVYQPEISLNTGHLTGFEALIRWRRPDGEMVAPVDFIPLAETTGQIVEIGRWVVAEAVHQLSIWHRDTGRNDLNMAVNVSGRQLSDEGFAAYVGHQLRRFGVPAACLTLELTETSLISDQELATRRLLELRNLGVRIAVDDYGAGHASIGYLREFPIDIVKIDRSFVAALDDRPEEAEAFLRSITDLARGLHLDTVAEGIEHSEQLVALQQLGCEIGQGYHLARPLDVASAGAFLAQRGQQPVRERGMAG